MRKEVVAAMRPLDAISVENGVGANGCPDVNYVGGWMELKAADQWPVRGGPLRLEHPYTEEQKIWAFRRRRAGGVVWVFLKVGKDWLLFDSAIAADLLGTSTREELIKISAAHWQGKAEMVRCLCAKLRGENDFGSHGDGDV